MLYCVDGNKKYEKKSEITSVNIKFIHGEKCHFMTFFSLHDFTIFFSLLDDRAKAKKCVVYSVISPEVEFFLTFFL